MTDTSINDANLSWLSEYNISFEILHQKLQVAFAADNFLDISRLVALIDLLKQSNNKKFKQSIASHMKLDDSYVIMREDWLKRLIDWKDKLKVDDEFDNYHETDRKWYRVKLLHRDGDMIRIHYQGWASKFDLTISLKASKSFPARFRVQDKKSKVVKRNSLSSNADEDEDLSAIDNDITMKEERHDQPIIHVDAIESDPNLKTRSGRKLPDPNIIVAASKSKRKKVPKEERPDRNEWICGVCHFLESDDSNELLLCDGQCMRSYHLACLGLTKADVQSVDDKWLCPDCTAGQHNCFLCGVKGVDDKEVFKCQIHTCGKYYHHTCLDSDEGLFVVPEAITRLRDQVHEIAADIMVNRMTDETSIPKPIEDVLSPIIDKDDTVKSESPIGKRRKAKPNRYSEELDMSMNTMDNATDTTAMTTAATITTTTISCLNADDIAAWATLDFSFKCPSHVCDTCYEYYGSNGVGSLFRCVKCPRAFHINCIPPGSRYNSMCLLCPLHPDEILPSKAKPVVDISRTEYGWLWDQMPLPENSPSCHVLLDHHYRLATWLREDVDSQPTDFKMLSRLEYDSLPNKRKSLPYYESEDHCGCTVACDDNCLNRILNVECCEISSNAVTKFKSNCNIINQMPAPIPKNFDCGNKQLQYREYSQYEKFREFNRGFGLRAVSDIVDGSLVIEYIGEVIDEVEMITRMTNQRIYSPTDHDFYIMELDTGYYVDGKIKGNYSRYINHSCDPNCELQRWVVQGTMRIGIFAIRDIKAGESLSYDYQFDTREDNIFKCYCESSNCRGTMAPAKNRNQHINQYISKMHMKLLKDPMSLCQECTTSDVLNKRLINDYALACLPIKDRRKLVELGRNDENKRLEVSQSVEQQMTRSYVSSYLPGDGVNEIRSGPLRSTYNTARSHKIFLPRATKLGTNFLKRRRLYASKDYMHLDAITYDNA